MPSQYNVITRQPISRLASVMSLANRASGGLMVLTGILAFVNALPAAFSSLLLSVYVGGFGALLLLYEFTASTELKQDFGFMYTYAGRAAFLLLVANLSWTCSPIGFYCAVLTNANAAVQAYIIFAHPSFVEGQASRFAIGGDDAAMMSYSADTFDPASNAARARGSFGQK